ncbi:cornifelin homolog A isoform X3 [Perca flavescens]|uniref:cornifelin homolog A isoform X3 n=1 Tax=Perca flavescens TaxID=8167 RepID=UPI00106EAEF5|nr:cornifelin homolog A-like isoform X3 [Perca flavescens]
MLTPDSCIISPRFRVTLLLGHVRLCNGCYGFWCCPCLACTVSGRFGENRCLPLCDICSPAILAALGIPLCAAPPAGLSLRAAMRNRYGIKGSLCKDIAVSCFCGWCNWCQMHRFYL